MTALNFEPAEEPATDVPDLDANDCHCKPGDNQYLLEIEDGQPVLRHAACGKQPPGDWEDWGELVYMNPIPVTVEWERDCTGSAWHGLSMCDCNMWVQVTATSVPEDVRDAALELSRKHTAQALGKAAEEATA
jgi:hypothetical protein